MALPKKLTIGSSAKTIPRLPRPTNLIGAKKTIPKGPRPIAGATPSGGRLKPVVVKPVVKPPGLAPPPPKGPDFNDWYKTDPRYLLQHPQFAAQKAGLYAQYGWQPSTDAAGNVTGYTQSSAADNPYSIVNQLSEALAGKSQNVQDSANSRGLLFSGAQVQGQQNAAHAYEGQLSDAQQAFQRALAGVNTDESSLLSSLYPDYLAQAPPATPPGAAVPGAPAAKPPVTPASAAAAEAARKARVKKAQDHLRQDKINAAKKKRTAPPKKTPAGKKPTIGSNAGSLKGI